MNRIYYQGSFKLATDWPELKDEQPQSRSDYSNTPEGQYWYEQSIISWKARKQGYKEKYTKAIASAMENGVRFEDQEKVKRKCFFHGDYFPLPDMEESEQELKDWEPKEGDNWPAPEGAEIVEQDNHIEGYIWKTSKVAVLKSESVEKKETGKQRAYQKMLRYLISIRDSAAEAGELSFLPQAINTMTDIINDAINHSEYDR